MIDEAVIGEKYRLLGGLMSVGCGVGRLPRRSRWDAAELLRSLARPGSSRLRSGAGAGSSGPRSSPRRGGYVGAARDESRLTEIDPTLLEDLERLVDDTSRGRSRSAAWFQRAARAGVGAPEAAALSYRLDRWCVVGAHGAEEALRRARIRVLLELGKPQG